MATGLETGRKPITVCRQSMMPKSVKRFSDDIMLYLFDLEPDSDSGQFDLKSSGSSAHRWK
ncbi:hypothetical protein [Mesorhizobium sp. LSJC268A00]|uniref:hypothetical protein n=1 Tax=Mesorhizobium sp. LSJC268A00 TaxID=1287325 RepID=UPI001AEBDC87|nr:hypothetical protein [Mesorhizobium sp. LSJC268A00]